jgi:hypothetical protein
MSVEMAERFSVTTWVMIWSKISSGRADNDHMWGGSGGFDVASSIAKTRGSCGVESIVYEGED